MGDVPLDKAVLDEIHGIFENRSIYLGDMVNEIADIVSKATNYPAVVMLKGFEKLIIKNVKIYVNLFDPNPLTDRRGFGRIIGNVCRCP